MYRFFFILWKRKRVVAIMMCIKLNWIYLYSMNPKQVDIFDIEQVRGNFTYIW